MTRVEDYNGLLVERPKTVSQLSGDAVRLEDYSHSMQKEIFEQPEVPVNAIEIIGGSKLFQLRIFGADATELLAVVEHVLILACRTSVCSEITARYWLESVVGIPCAVEIARQYRYKV